jgi:hypothetical protein
MNRSFLALTARRQWSRQQQQGGRRYFAMYKEATPQMKQRNVLTALALTMFVGGVYYTAISKMRQTDELSKVIDREEQKKK